MQNQLSRYASLSLALAVGTMLGACKGQRSGPAVSESAGGNVSAPATGDTTGAMGGTAMGTDTTGGRTTGADTTGAAAGGLSGLSDVNYAALVDEANMADSTAGALALKKATNARVKSFARMMMSDHHSLRRQGQQLVKQLNVTPQPPANDPVQQLAQQETSALQSAQKGAAFDSTYIDQEVKAHQAVLDLLKTVESDAQNEQLKALAKKAQPVIQMHLTEAQSIQKRLTSAS